jgi:hypothetical protein
MSLPIKTDALVVVSGGAADPKVVSGTADPTAGFVGPEGSIYLRYGAGVGRAYVKSGPLSTDWGQITAGGASGTLDDSYDFGGPGAGRVIAADSGALRLDAGTNDTQAALQINRLPGAAVAAVGIDLVLSASVNASGAGLQVTDPGAGTSIKVAKSNSGSAFQATLSNAGAKALEVIVSAAPTSVSPVSIVANTTGTTADLLSVSKIPGAATAGNALSVSMGANTSGSGIYVSNAGTGPAIEVAAGAIQVANSAAAVSPASTGRIRYNSGTQTFQVSLNGAAYVDIATGAGFTLDIGDAIGSSTVGSALFVGAGNVLQQDNANFFWDNTNKRLGIGTATPAFPLDVKGLLGNTAGKFGDQYPIALVSGTNFVVWSSVGFSSYYNGGWRFADMTAGTYGAYMTFDNSAATWSFYRSNANFTGSGSLWGTPALHMTMGDNLFRLPYLAGGGSNRAGLVFADPTGKLGIDVAGDDLWWDTLNKRIVMGGIPAWAGATIDIRKGFGEQIRCRNTVAPSASSGATIRVSNESNLTAANQRMGGYVFGSYQVDIITVTTGAAIEAYSEAAWTAGSSHPTYLSFQTAASGSASPVERMRVTSDGAIQMPNGSGGAVSEASTGRIRYNTTGQKFQVSANGGAYVDIQLSPEFTIDIGDSVGSGTAGSVLFVGATGLLAQDNAGLNWNTTSRTLGIATNHATSGPLFLQNTVTTGPSGFGAIDSAVVQVVLGFL